MGVFYKNGGAWKTVPRVWTKVAGVWKLVPKAFVKVNGDWKVFHSELDYIPEGAIALYNSGDAAPTDWALLTTGDGNYIKGWDGTLGDILQTGGNNNIVFGSSSDPSHGSGNTSFNSGYGYAAKYATLNYGTTKYTRGGHSHTITVADARWAMVRQRLIQAQKAVTVLPANASCWGAGSLTLSELAVQDHLIRNSANADVLAENLTGNATTNTTGNHDHINDPGDGIGTSAGTYYHNNAGNHSHTFTVPNISLAVARTCVKVFTTLSAVGTEVDMIFGWPNITAPPGYALCDGSNGTIDLRNNFLAADDTETPGTVKGAGTGTVDLSYDTGDGGGHNHRGGYTAVLAPHSSWHSNNRVHSHVGTVNQAYNPLEVTLAFIQKVA